VQRMARGVVGSAMVPLMAVAGACLGVPLPAQTGDDALAAAESTVVVRIAVAAAETLVVTTTGAGPPVVLLPGPLGGSFGYRLVVARLACAGRRVIVVAPLGFGWSPHPRRADYSLDAQADRVAAVLDSLGVRGAVVGAHNMGASIALRLAYEHPDLVAAVVSLDGGPVERPVTPGLRTAMRLAPILSLFGAGRFVRGRVRGALESHSASRGWITDQVVSAYAAPIARDVGGTLATLQAMERATNRAPLLANLSRIHVPVLLLVGGAKRDGGVGPDEVALLRDSIPHFSVDTVSDSGIYLQEEQPDTVADALLRLVPAGAAAAPPHEEPRACAGSAL